MNKGKQMKLRNLLITLGLTLTVGVGVAVATDAKQNDETKTAEAASTACDVYFKAKWSGANITIAKVHYWNGGDYWMEMTPVYEDGGYQVYKYTIPAGNSEFQYQTYTSNWGSGEWHTSVNRTVSNNLLCTPAESWDGSNFNLSNGTAYPYTINYNGNGSSSGSMSSETAYGNVSWGLAKNKFARTGYYFNGWNTSSDGSGSAYTDEGLLPVKLNTTAVTVYAQWVYTNPTVYFVNGHSWGTPHVYYWGGDASTDYPGPAMAATVAKIHCLVGEAWFDIGIYQYTITGSPTKLQFNKGDDSAKTLDLDAVNGNVYWYGVDAEKFGSVASYLISFMNSMGSYTYNGKTYTNSICGLSSASTFVSTYSSIVSGGGYAATSIQNSTINTYATPVTSPSGSTTDIAMSVLIGQIQKNISGGVYGSIRGFGFLNLRDNGGALIVVIVASLGILSVGAYFFFKKSKKSEE